jgi:hypothetical protein
MDAANYLSCRLPRRTRTFSDRFIAVPGPLMSNSLNMPFLSSSIIRSTTRRSSCDLKSFKTLS